MGWPQGEEQPEGSGCVLLGAAGLRVSTLVCGLGEEKVQKVSLCSLHGGVKAGGVCMGIALQWCWWLAGEKQLGLPPPHPVNTASMLSHVSKINYRIKIIRLKSFIFTISWQNRL